MNRIQELRARRQELAERAAGLRAKSERTPDENEQYDLTMRQLVECDEDIEREERYLESERRDAEFMRRNGGGNLAGSAGASNEQSGQQNGSSVAAAGGEQRQVATVDGREMELRSIRGRTQERDESGLRQVGDVPVYRDPHFREFLRSGRHGDDAGWFSLEARAFQADSPTEGGYLSRGEQFVAQLIQAVDDMVFIRQRATVIPVNDGNTSLGVPTLDTDAEDWDWTVELGTGNEEDSIRFGRRSLTPHPLAKRVKLSRELLRASALPAERIVLARMAYKLGVTQEKGFLTGTGQGQPLGVYVASEDGISTSRDVSTGNEQTSITFDGLQEAKFTLKAAYWPRARWNFHRTAVKQIAKLKDGEGRYMWEPSVRAGVPDQLFSFPMDISEFSPSTFTTGQYVGMLADWSHYWIADSLSMQMQRLAELYAETNQVGFIGRIQTDGMPVLEEAFVRVKLA